MRLENGFRAFRAKLIPLFPSWTSPVRIRSPALNGTTSPNATYAYPSASDGAVPNSSECRTVLHSFFLGVVDGTHQTRHPPVLPPPLLRASLCHRPRAGRAPPRDPARPVGVVRV